MEQAFEQDRFDQEPEVEQAAPQRPTFRPKPDEGRSARRGMDSLREQALQNLISKVEDRNFSGLRSRSFGHGFTPSRVILVSVALLAGGVAAYLATTLQPPEPPAPEVVTQVVAAPTAQVLVAKDTIAVGQRVTASALEWIEWPENAVPAGFVTQAATPDAITDMEGSVVRSEILPGEPILEQKLVAPGGSYLASVLATGKRAVSVPVKAASASGGFIAPNDRVDLVATRIFETSQATETILRNVRVLALNGQLGEQGSEVVRDESQTDIFDGDALATLELSPAEAELVIQAVATGSLSMVLRSVTDLDADNPSKQMTANQAIRASSPFWLK